MNEMIASQLGVKKEFDNAVALLKKKGVLRHGYVLIRKDTEDTSEPTVILNYFGEIKQLGRYPWFVDEAPEL